MTTRKLRPPNTDIVAHYGGVILNLRGVSQQLDYPVDKKAAELIYRYLPEINDNYAPFSWMHFKTMNNYKLFVNLKTFKIANLYSDDYNAASSFFHPEVYRIICHLKRKKNSR
ncbi:hypothetical protein IQ238_14880 [Pleurocapsales cyanobacterium LEGE 06147]|nr:hypothetical protein [Pleurocapsales cyanobacterium LEGE 06147]